ncbi:MAG: helix-turn-helix transcriptional regulator [Rhodospirillales bacterium]|nr:helix-turn-helix transcriptional regulator [Rhodospirillales bacterium]
MVELETTRLDAVFHALGDATRRRMLRDLTDGERSVGELAAPFDMSLAAASKHVKALERAGLVRRTVKGRTHLCRLDAARLAEAHRWIEFYRRFWEGRLDVLEDLLRQKDAAGTDRPKGDDHD